MQILHSLHVFDAAVAVLTWISSRSFAETGKSIQIHSAD